MGFAKCFSQINRINVVRPPRIRAEANRVSLTDEVGTDCIDEACLHWVRRVQQKHFALYHIREMRFAKITFAKPQIPNGESHSAGMLGNVFVGFSTFKRL